jgi:inhibitor of cysteine peptidase
MGKKRYVSFMLLAFLGFSWLSAWAADTPENKPQNAGQETTMLTDLNKPIIVSPASPTFTIRVAANATTGYQWFITDYNPRLVKLLSQQYVTKQTQSTGSAGTSVWEFQLQQMAFLAPHLTHITLEYRRPWESKAVKHHTFTIISGK